MIFFKNYYDEVRRISDDSDHSDLIRISELIELTHDKKGKVIILGNGGSSAISSHCVVDLTKAARIRAVTFSDAATLTCFGNDYGYEYGYSKAIEFYADPLDMVILISSSGASKNMLNAAHTATTLGLPLVTLTGFKENNPLKPLGDVNLWANSNSYNYVETIHQTWLLSVIDYIISKKGN